MKIIRVFPRRTKLTPDDAEVAIGRGPNLLDDYDEAHISTAFTWDIPLAKHLADAWSKHCLVKIGGPATGEHGADFEPGMYLKHGAVITSRGCPNRCWFCSVWRREGNEIRELSIRDGWNVLDDNLLQCSEKHIRGVFEMLKRQKKEGNRILFTGGLEAAALNDWHIDLLCEIKPRRMFFAYDTPDDYEPLRNAGKRLLDAGFTRTSKTLCCYCLVGFPRDTFDAAEKRLRQSLEAGFTPMAMLFRDKSGETDKEWKVFQREWARPAIINSKIKK